MFGYHYKSLTKPEKRARRTALDSAGHWVLYAQLLILLALWLYLRTTRWNRHKFTGGRLRALRRWEWRLAYPLAPRYPILRCWGDWGVVAAWCAFCLYLAVRGAGDDYIHLTKAFGIIAAANLPLHFLLAMKHSPFLSLFGYSYEGHLNFLHRWLGRVIFHLFALHGICYLSYFWDASKMTTRLLEFDILCGVFAFLSTTLLVISSNHLLREIAYSLFYKLHILTALSLFPLLYLHVSHLRPYLLISSVFILTDAAIRFFTCRRMPATATISRIGNDLLSISLNLHHATPLPAGSHLLLRIPSISRFNGHPFTLATTSPTTTTLIARIRSNFTRKLATLLEPVQAYVEGPYGAAADMRPPLQSYDKILFVAGGVGGTFAVAMAKELLVARGGQLRFVWAVKRAGDTAWAFAGESKVAEVVELFVTGPVAVEDEEDDGVEMQDARLLLAKDEMPVGVKVEQVKSGRPECERIVAETIASAGREGRTAVLVCGPEEMAMRVKCAAGKMAIEEGSNVFLHIEQFGH